MLSKNKQIITAFGILLAYFTCLFYYYNNFMVKKSRETQTIQNVQNSYIDYEEKTNETCINYIYNKTHQKNYFFFKLPDLFYLLLFKVKIYLKKTSMWSHPQWDNRDMHRPFKKVNFF